MTDRQIFVLKAVNHGWPELQSGDIREFIVSAQFHDLAPQALLWLSTTMYATLQHCADRKESQESDEAREKISKGLAPLLKTCHEAGEDPYYLLKLVEFPSGLKFEYNKAARNRYTQLQNDDPKYQEFCEMYKAASHKNPKSIQHWSAGAKSADNSQTPRHEPEVIAHFNRVGKLCTIGDGKAGPCITVLHRNASRIESTQTFWKSYGAKGRPSKLTIDPETISNISVVRSVDLIGGKLTCRAKPTYIKVHLKSAEKKRLISDAREHNVSGNPEEWGAMSSVRVVFPDRVRVKTGWPTFHAFEEHLQRGEQEYEKLLNDFQNSYRPDEIERMLIVEKRGKRS